MDQKKIMVMDQKKIMVYDAKPYDRISFDDSNNGDFKIKYIENKLNADTAPLARGYDGVVAFVNDSIDEMVVNELNEAGVKVLALRSAGYNNVDLKAAFGKLRILRVPAYSPHAVAEHAMALLLAMSRKIHKAYNRTREYNFSLSGLTGFNLNGRTVGIVGMGQIGSIFADICLGFGMKVLAYDSNPREMKGVKFVDMDTLLSQSDVISLHCPLTPETFHLLSKESLSKAKKGVYIINTSRGALIDSEALLTALRSGKVAGAALDVYEEESDYFFEDFSEEAARDDILSLLVTHPNVIVTSHQAFLTREALKNIADTTLENFREYFAGIPPKNEICYRCDKKSPPPLSVCAATDNHCKFKLPVT